MKYLRQYISQILSEIAHNRRDAFLADLHGLGFDTKFKDTTDEDEASEEEIATAYRRMKTEESLRQTYRSRIP